MTHTVVKKSLYEADYLLWIQETVAQLKGISKNRSIWGKGFEQLVTKTSTIKER